eukprot:TRINITY_DN12631_c0_g1_i1.p1 TRINITY_DN12631_c0_g1~~TRINITY_DN12631_c0_g1_i1.p1  ORF type:complete len:338 (+),score=91.50 TRINITY_DN12631_c0_g1_i1:80-1093(+)
MPPVKVHCCGTYRRFNAGTYGELLDRVCGLFDVEVAQLSYVDGDGDTVQMNTDEEFQLGCTVCGSVMRVEVTPIMCKEPEPEHFFFPDFGAWKGKGKGKGGKGWGKGRCCDPSKGWGGKGWFWEGEGWADTATAIAKLREMGFTECDDRLSHVLWHCGGDLPAAVEKLSKRRSRCARQEEAGRKLPELREKCSDFALDATDGYLKRVLARCHCDVDKAAQRIRERQRHVDPDALAQLREILRVEAGTDSCPFREHRLKRVLLKYGDAGAAAAFLCRRRCGKGKGKGRKGCESRCFQTSGYTNVANPTGLLTPLSSPSHNNSSDEILSIPSLASSVSS